MASSLYMAKLAEEAERYQDLADFIASVSIPDHQEFNLIAVAWAKLEKAVSTFHWFITFVGGEESGCSEDDVSSIKNYRSKIEKEISDIRDKVSHPRIKEYLAEFKVEESEIAYAPPSPKKDDGPEYYFFGVHIRDLRPSSPESGLPEYEPAAKKKKMEAAFDRDRGKRIESPMSDSDEDDDFRYRKPVRILMEEP